MACLGKSADGNVDEIADPWFYQGVITWWSFPLYSDFTLGPTLPSFLLKCQWWNICKIRESQFSYFQSTSPWHLPTSAVGRTTSWLWQILRCRLYHADDSSRHLGVILRKRFFGRKTTSGSKAPARKLLPPKKSASGVQTNQQALQEGEILFQSSLRSYLKTMPVDLSVWKIEIPTILSIALVWLCQ